MSKLQDIVNKANWRYHMNGGYYEREILNGDDLDTAAAELADLRDRLARAEQERGVVEELNKTVVDYNATLQDVLRRIVEWVDDMGDDFQHDEAWEGIEADARKALAVLE